MKSLLLGIIYLLFYLLLAFLAAGAGHGTYLFFAPIMPFGLGFILFLLVFYLFDKLDSPFGKNAYLILMTTHYIFTIFWLVYWWNNDNGYEYLMKTWRFSSLIVLMASGWYLLGQIIIWVNFYKSVGKLKENPIDFELK